MTSDTCTPFPVDCLPGPARVLVVEGAAAIQCDPAMLGPCVLGAMAAAVGNARTIRLKPGWVEPAVLWVAIVAESGSCKSPALRLATEPLVKRDGENFRAFLTAKADYEARDGAEPMADDRPDFPPVDVSEPPQCERLVADDATLEALASILQSNPRGVLLRAHELTSLLGGFGGRYSKGGRKGSEEARWLPLYDADPLILDRVSRGPTRVDRAAVSIVGAIQPGVLARALTTADFENGMVARFLLARPPIPERVWADDDGLSPDTVAGYAAMIGKMLSLPVDPDPPASTLTIEAGRAWGSYYNAMNRETHDALHCGDGRKSAMLSKLVGSAARLALVIHTGRWAAGEAVDLERIDAESMRRGITLARWFRDQALRVYAAIDEPEGERAELGLIDLIRNRGGSITARVLARSASRYRQSGAAQDALDGLAHDGVGEWIHLPIGPDGGRPSRVFQLLSVVTKPSREGSQG